MILVRLKLDILEESLNGPNSEFIEFFIKNYLINYKNKIKIILWKDNNNYTEFNIDKLIKLFKEYNIPYDITTGLFNYKITIDVLENKDDEIFNGRFKIYYNYNQNSYVNALLNLASTTEALFNNINNKNQKESIIEEIKINKAAYKKANM